MSHDHFRIIAETCLYLGQALIYAFAFQSTRNGAHAPCQTYLASSFIHATLAVELLL